MSIRVLIADDHEIVRFALKHCFTPATGTEVVAEATTGTEAVSLSATLKPDVVLMDLAMPEMNGLEAIRCITSRRQAPGIVVISGQTGEKWVMRAIRAGARGFVTKTEGAEPLLTAVKTVFKGGMWFSNEIELALRRLAADPNLKHMDPLDRLSARHRVVLQLVAEGLTNKQVAEQLKISESTVDSHRTELMRRLGVTNVASLVRFACQERVVDID